MNGGTDLSQGEFGEEIGALVRLAELELRLGRHIDLGTRELGCDEGLEGAEVVGVRVQSLKELKGRVSRWRGWEVYYSGSLLLFEIFADF